MMKRSIIQAAKISRVRPSWIQEADSGRSPVRNHSVYRERVSRAGFSLICMIGDFLGNDRSLIHLILCSRRIYWIGGCSQFEKIDGVDSERESIFSSGVLIHFPCVKCPQGGWTKHQKIIFLYFGNGESCAKLRLCSVQRRRYRLGFILCEIFFQRMFSKSWWSCQLKMRFPGRFGNLIRRRSINQSVLQHQSQLCEQSL